MANSQERNESQELTRQTVNAPAQKTMKVPLFPQKPKKLCRKKDYMEFCEILKNCQGLVTTACRMYGISRQQYYLRYNQDEEFRNMVEYVNESIKDFGEGALLKKIKDGDTAAIIFYAKTKLKDRGYVERQEITGKDGEAIAQQNIVNVDIDINSLTIEQRQALLSLAEANINKID